MPARKRPKRLSHDDPLGRGTAAVRAEVRPCKVGRRAAELESIRVRREGIFCPSLGTASVGGVTLWHFPCSESPIGGGVNKEKGAIGYILLWLMGVPATVLFLIFLLRGCT